MRLRFPEGMRSVVDATLALQGPAAGTDAERHRHGRERELDARVRCVGQRVLARRRRRHGLPVGARSDVDRPRPLPMRYDVRDRRSVDAAHRERAWRASSRAASLTLRGTFDRPLLFGRADIERGEVRFEGRRYQVTRGSLDFTNPNRIQPFFDIEAETRVRVPGQTYRVTLRMAGTTERHAAEFTSDPPLAPIDILTLLFSDTAPTGDIELASLRQPNQREQDISAGARHARADRRPVARGRPGRAADVRRRHLPDHAAPDRPVCSSRSRLNVNPAARVTIGKRISDRVYLTYARSLSSSTRDEIILLEYDQNDSLGWVLSQNEDRTYALEVRKTAPLLMTESRAPGRRSASLAPARHAWCFASPAARGRQRFPRPTAARCARRGRRRPVRRPDRAATG